jgi:hypothetical protein
MVPYILVTYVQFKVQLDVHFMYFSFFILSCMCFGCYMHPSSGAQLQHTAIGVCTKTIDTTMAVHCSCAPDDGCKQHLKHVELRIKKNKNI